MNAKTKAAEGVAVDVDGLLVKYGLSDLPEVFAMRGDSGMIQERDACYECRADGFYGQGDYVTWYPEGSIIVLDTMPNDHLMPLNRAAGAAFARWKESLPSTRVPLDIGEMSEAAMMLAKDPRVQELDPESAQKAVIKLAESLKMKRMDKAGLTVPSIQHNFNPASGGKSPPIMGARMSEMTQRPGSNTAVRVAPGQTPGARLANPPAAPALANQR